MADDSKPTPPFAEVSDLEARWHTLTADEQKQAKALIDDASQMIIDLCPGYVDASAATLRAIVCAMVKRAMINNEQSGITQGSETTGPFSNQYTYANPTGDLYLTKAEKQRLGEGVQHAFHIDLSDGSVG